MLDLKILPGITLATLVLSLTLSVPKQGQAKVASARAIAPATKNIPLPQQTIAQKQNRTALVIGNTEYQQATSLRNPKNDATDIANVLEELGFEAIVGWVERERNPTPILWFVGLR